MDKDTSLKIMEGPNLKVIRSTNYNFNFDKTNGNCERWGKTLEEDPQFSPYGPEIADVEIGTICHGIDNVPCSWCYKSNNPVVGSYMSAAKFIEVLSCMPRTVTQIAFGLGDIDSNPDLAKIFKACHCRGIIPNITINGDRLTDYYLRLLQDNCGAVAVSRYPNNKDLCYNAVEKLSEKLDQVNIHCLLSKDTMDVCHDVAVDQLTEPRLAKMRAIVYLALKPKGLRNKLTGLTYQEYACFLDWLLLNQVRFGFDSCSANAFLKAVKPYKNAEKLTEMAEPCESTCFSIYVDVHGDVYPCSFCAGEMAGKPIKKGFWNDPYLKAFREMLIKNERSCPMFDVLPDKSEELDRIGKLKKFIDEFPQY